MSLDTACCMCGRFDEDGAHLFFKCKDVRQVWSHLQLDQTRVNLAQVLSARELVEAVLNMHQDEQRKVITFLYLWWTERCGVREGEKKRDSIMLAALIRSYAEEWSSVGCHKKISVPARSEISVEVTSRGVGEIKLRWSL